MKRRDVAPFWHGSDAQSPRIKCDELHRQTLWTKHLFVEKTQTLLSAIFNVKSVPHNNAERCSNARAPCNYRPSWTWWCQAGPGGRCRWSSPSPCRSSWSTPFWSNFIKLTFHVYNWDKVQIKVAPRGQQPPLLSGSAWRQHLCNPRDTEAKNCQFH